MTLACPGPIATGAEGTPRNVFSAEGLTAKHEARGGAKKRLPPPRVAELIARAAYNRADVAWIARHPVLLLGESRSRKSTDSSPGRIAATGCWGWDQRCALCLEPGIGMPLGIGMLLCLRKSLADFTVVWKGALCQGRDGGRSSAGYLCQYWPSLGIWIMKKIGPMRAAQLKSGGSGYNIKSMLFGRGAIKAD